MHPVLSAQSVHKVYRLGDTEVHALRDIRLDVEEGEFLSLAGPSGSGKTTLLNLFGCIDRPTSGEIFVDGERVSTKSGDELARFRAQKLGYIFQTFNLLPVLTALENVEYPLLILEQPARKRGLSAREALTKVGLENFASHRPDQLSGGQRQRVAIARALVKQPRIILADEPTANLDKKTAGEILDLLKTLSEREKVTVLFSTHDPMILSRANRVFQMSDGQAVS